MKRMMKYAALAALLFCAVAVWVNRHQLLNLNELEVEAEGIDPSRVEVRWDMLSPKPPLLIWAGDEQRQVPGTYGKNIFIIEYARPRPEGGVQTWYAWVTQFKTNNWHDHDYEIRVSDPGDGPPRFEFVAEGPDAVQESGAFSPESPWEGEYRPWDAFGTGP